MKDDTRELIERLRNGPYTVGPASGEIHELHQAADALAAYRKGK